MILVQDGGFGARISDSARARDPSPPKLVRRIRRDGQAKAGAVELGMVSGDEFELAAEQRGPVSCESETESDAAAGRLIRIAATSKRSEDAACVRWLHPGTRVHDFQMQFAVVTV